jgi:hypothetical protein
MTVHPPNKRNRNDDPMTATETLPTLLDVDDRVREAATAYLEGRLSLEGYSPILEAAGQARPQLRSA